MESLCLRICMLFLLVQFSTGFSSLNNNKTSMNIHAVCHEDERQLLLELKQQFPPIFPKLYYRTKYWTGSRDCCVQWDGVTCDDSTGHVIGLDISFRLLSTDTQLTGNLKLMSSSLFRLTHLRKLNLANNLVGGSAIPSEFGRLNALTHLNLSCAGFGGEIPMEFYHLSNLLSLDLSANFDCLNNLLIRGLPWVSATVRCDLKMLFGNMTRLRVLLLSRQNLSNSEMPTNVSSFLTHLDLEDTGLRGKLPAATFETPDMQILKLSGNEGLQGSLPKTLNWSNVQELDLSGTSISGTLPHSIGLMTNLNHLVLSWCRFSGPIPESIGNITAITLIDWSYNQFSGRLPDSIGLMTNLNYLYLSGCGFSGPIPESIGNITGITSIDLSDNYFSSRLPDSIGLMANLNWLDLSHCRFSGPIPESIGNITAITSIDWSYNEFSARIPSTISNLRHLTRLDLSSNHLEGQLPDVFSGLQNLTYLDLSHNSLEGRIPSSLTNMSQLRRLDIRSNALTGPLPSKEAGHGLQELVSMSLLNNSIQGTIPPWLFTLPSLVALDLSSNRLTGRIGKLNSKTLIDLILSSNALNIELHSFYNLTSIEKLDISHNIVTEHDGDNAKNVTFPNLKSLDMSSCEIKEFPNLLRSNMPILVSLVLSNNNIHGQLPTWFTSNPMLSLSYLDLSANFLTYAGDLPWQGLSYLDLHSNSLRGTFPSSICNITRLFLLNLSHNKLSGNIPECITNSTTQLDVLDLRRNEFHGKIPTTIGVMVGLNYLGLEGNQLEGPLPPSLANCTRLEVIDLGNNIIHDTFPWWLHTIPELKILILKSNSFHGSIATPANFTNNSFTNLHILDLSYNNFTGLLPERFFASLEAIKNQSQVSPYGRLYMGNNEYEYSVTLSVKGAYTEFTKVLKIFTTIDLSSNNFNGSIPVSLSNLTSLRLLNLSHNSIHGSIPPALSRMSNLEQLDLSSNQLTGGIPQSLTSLTFLGALNLSHNHLVGPIPQGNQFLTFSNESYSGNSGLCGAPLTRSCGDEKEAPSAGEDEDDGFMMGFTWKTVVVGYGCGILLGFILGNILLSIERPRWLARFVYVEAAIILSRRKKRRRRRVVQGAASRR